MAVFAWLQTQISKQVSQVFPWAVVFYGIGIWLYFALPHEPHLSWGVAGFAVAVLLAASACRFRHLIGIAGLLPVLLLLGYSMAALNARAQAAPVLSFHYYGPIYGRVVEIDRSSSHALRLTLDQVLLTRPSADEIPARVRVSLHGRQDWLTPRPGQYVGLTGHLSAPNGPVEPDGFDFQRHAWFLKLGAVGYTRTPALEMQPPGGEMPISTLRHGISRYVSGYLSGDIGGFAAAVTTGDRSAFSQEAIEALRVSNLGHLLAISGLHMGLLAGFLFGFMRLALSLWQPLALRIPVKKISALSALAGASCYLLLSGASIATQRAFIMAAVALVAVSLDRRALTLRAVAIAALIVLILRPSSLLSPGFQMSFAATTALVAVFSATRSSPDIGLKRWQRSIVALVLSSLVAGLATAPFAAAHFNQWAAYGLLANVSAVPAMGLIVIPGAVLAGMLAPFGLDWFGLEVMAIGLRWILFIAHWISGLEGARVPVISPQAVVLPLISLGGCWLVLWQGALRWLGLLAGAIAIAIWSQAQRPDILISGDGKLVGVMSVEGRVLSKARGQGFVAQSWLENDGDAAGQEAAARRGDEASEGVFGANMGTYSIVHFQGKTGAAGFTGCRAGEIVILDQRFEGHVQCSLFDASRLAETGAVAIWIKRDGAVTLRTVARSRGQRLWSPPAQKDQ